MKRTSIDLTPKIVALAMRVLRVMVFPLLLNAIPLPDGERPASNYTPNTNLNVKVLDFVQLGGLSSPLLLFPGVRSVGHTR